MKDVRPRTALGQQIEGESFAIIDREAGRHAFGPREWQVVRRVIHASADFEFLTSMAFHPDAVTAGVRALAGGCPIVVDVEMIRAGLCTRACGCAVHSFISDEDVAIAARQANTTRAVAAMRKAQRLKLLDGAVVAIGNAPTALLEVLRLMREEAARPALLLGVPVGFVSAAEAKEAARRMPIPSIVTTGRKGGSPIAVAIIHALLALHLKGT